MTYHKIPLVTIRSVTARSVSAPHWRPQTRLDCADIPRRGSLRPCPYVGCRHHLDSDEHDAGHEPRVTIDRLNELRPSCSLDVADRGRVADLDEIAALTGLWHTAAEEALASGMAKMRADPMLAELFSEVDERDHVHPLADAQRWAEAAPDVDE